MTYFILGLSLLIILFLILKKLAKNSKTPENQITYFYQALELEYFKENPDSAKEPNELDYSLLSTAGYFYSRGKSIKVILDLDEIKDLAEYAVQKFTQRPDRLAYFVILYKTFQKFKEKKIPINLEENSSFIQEVNDPNNTNLKLSNVVQDHLLAGKAPLGHQVLTKKMISHSPNWIELDFN